MSGLSDGDIAREWLNPENYGCAVTVIVGVLAAVTAVLAVVGHAAMGLV